jgi:hypothetical protein
MLKPLATIGTLSYSPIGKSKIKPILCSYYSVPTIILKLINLIGKVIIM